MRCLAILALISSACIALCNTAKSETISLATQEWPPYHTAMSGKIDGISVRVIRCALERIGFSADIAIFPWAEAQQRVRDGKSDGFFSAARNAQRDAFATRSKGIAPQTWRWYWPEGRQVNLEDRETKIVVQSGTAMQQWLTDNGYKHVQAVETTQDVIALVKQGTVDVALASQLSFELGMMVSGIKEASISSQLLWSGTLGVYFGKEFLERHPTFLARFNAEIPSCRVGARIPETDSSAE